MKPFFHKVATTIWVVLGLFVFLCLLGASFEAGGWPGVLLLLVISGFLGWSHTDKKKKPEAPARATPAPAQAQAQFAPPFVPTWRQEQPPAIPLPLDPSWHSAPTADPHVQAYAREYGRFPPVHPGQITVLPPNQEQ